VTAGQPVFAGVYLTGDFDGRRRHAAGADVVASIGCLQGMPASASYARASAGPASRGA
jgi:hypothetical protein